MKRYDPVVKPGPKTRLYPIIWSEEDVLGYCTMGNSYTFLDPKFIASTDSSTAKLLKATYNIYERPTFDKRQQNSAISYWGILRSDYFYLAHLKRKSSVFVVDIDNECLQYVDMSCFTSNHKRIREMQRYGELSALDILTMLIL